MFLTLSVWTGGCPDLRCVQVRAAALSVVLCREDYWRLFLGRGQKVGGALGVGGINVMQRDTAGFLEEEH